MLAAGFVAKRLGELTSVGRGAGEFMDLIRWQDAAGVSSEKLAGLLVSTPPDVAQEEAPKKMARTMAFYPD